MVMKTHGRIFVVNAGGHNLSPALEHTTLPKGKAFVPITKGTINIFNINQTISDVTKVLIEEDFCEEDMMLLTGNVIINVIAVLAALEITEGVCSVLLYNALTRGYAKREIS